METMTEEQNGNGRRPMFEETDREFGERAWRIQNPFDIQREPVKYWLFWIGSGIVFVGLTIVCLRFIVLPTGFL